MKKLFIITLGFLSLGFSVNAAPKATPDSYSRPADFIVRGSYHSISINDDIDVVLTESDLAGITVVATDKVKNDIRISEKNGVLTISSTGKSLRNKAIVYVPVSNLAKLEINGSSRVSSAGVLTSAKLNVLVHGEASFEIKSQGEVIVEAGEEIDLHMEKQYASNKRRANKPNADTSEK